MKYFQFNKLVRDKIVENMEKSGNKPRGIRILKDKEYIEELKKKLQEETEEFLKVEDKEDLKEELADVQEVIDYLKEVLNFKEKDFQEIKEKKLKKVGGFKKRIYLESAGIQEDDKWMKHFESHPEKYPPIKPSSET